VKKQRRFRISNLKAFRPHVVLHNQSTPVLPPIVYCNHHTIQVPYPPDTTAFLYYFTSPERPRIGGELRLRVAPSDDHASFESGSDLLKLNGQPWSRSLFQVSKYYIPLYEKLREDGLVPDKLDTVLSTFPPRVIRCQLLYSFKDTFIVDFNSAEMFFFVITEPGMSTRQCVVPFAERHYSSPMRTSPYTGSALARFERSTLPDHKGTRTVVLRFLKIITPVKCVIPNYDGFIVPPKEGELHRKFNTRGANDKSNQPVWSVDIDKSVMLRGFQLLWDT